MFGGVDPFGAAGPKSPGLKSPDLRPIRKSLGELHSDTVCVGVDDAWVYTESSGLFGESTEEPASRKVAAVSAVCVCVCVYVCVCGCVGVWVCVY